MSSLAALRQRAQGAPILWNFLGDSITHGALHTWGHRDFVELIKESLTYRLGRKHDLVINAAHSGYRVGNLLAELEARCLRFQPDIVTINIGMNDACNGADGVPAYQAKLKELVGRIQAGTKALVFLQTINTIDLPNASSRASLAAYMAAVRTVGQELDLPVCDHYAVWEALAKHPGGNPYYLMSDAIHPNEYGHRLMADTLLRFLGYGPLSGLEPTRGFVPPVAG